jgi:hypothetical protein
LIVKVLKPLKLKKDSALLTGLLTHKIVRDALNLIQGISPLSFIDLRTASVSFRFVTQLKTFWVFVGGLVGCTFMWVFQQTVARKFCQTID